MFHTADSRAVLMDFGIARAAEIDASMTQTGIAIGTPHYMSPEQAKGLAVDPRSDLYSLGVVFYLMMAGSVPYDAESAVAIGIKHITEPVPLLPEAYASLQPLINRLMAKKPEDRFQSAKEFLSSLMRVNIPQLEQQIRLHRESAAKDGRDADGVVSHTSKSRTAKTPSAELTGFVQAEPHAETLKPAFVPFEDEDYEGKRGMNWVWAFSVAAILVGGVFVLREFKPGLVNPAFDTAGRYVSASANFVTGLFGGRDDPLAGLPTPEQLPAGEPASPVTAEPTMPTVVEVITPEPVVESTALPVHEMPTPEPMPEPTSSPTISVAATPVPTVEATGESPAIVALRTKAEELRSVYLGEEEKLPGLVDAYRALLANVPADEKANSELEAIKLEEVQRIVDKSEIGDAEAAGKRLLQLRYLFPELTETEVYKNLEKSVTASERINQLLAEADGFMARNALTIPAQDSALSRYQEILAIDPENKAAKSGLRSLSEKLVAFAGGKVSQGDDAAARVMLRKALELDDKNEKGRLLLDRLNKKAGEQRSRKDLLDRANSRLVSGDLFEPETNSAYYFYNEVLKKYPNDRDASEGMSRLMEALSSRVWGLVGAERFDQARAELERPMRLMGHTQKLQTLSAAVDQTIMERTGR